MPLQSENLAMVALGVLGDVPPESIQPVLDDGVHLRWAFDPERGFPWHGYYLFRRPHREPKRSCIARTFDPKWQAGPLGSATHGLADGTIESDAPLVATEQFAAAGARELDLRGRGYLRFTLNGGRQAREFQVTLGAFAVAASDGGHTDGPAEPGSPTEPTKPTEPITPVEPAPPPSGCLTIIVAPIRWLGDLFRPRLAPPPHPPPPPPAVTRHIPHHRLRRHGADGLGAPVDRARADRDGNAVRRPDGQRSR